PRPSRRDRAALAAGPAGPPRDGGRRAGRPARWHRTDHPPRPRGRGTGIPMSKRNEAPYVLSNGRYTVRLTAAGTGYSELNGRALTRWSPDMTRESDGFHIYIRDLDTGSVWSAGLEPVPLEPRHWEHGFDGARVVIHREDEDIALRLE